MLAPHNKIETRTWRTLYRGPVLFIASRIPFREQEMVDLAGQRMYDRIKKSIDEGMKMPVGVAYAVGDLVSISKMNKEDEHRTYVKFNPNIDLYCFHFDSVTPIIEFPVRGNVGLMPLKPEITEQIKPINI